ncbi:MAG: NAD-dependent protein deacylase [Actinomycetales bacterium]|nr:NAD-dependent protein deacylase [Actinomycetales bacterium]
MDGTQPVALSGRIVFFTGAGVSVGAGLPTYRGTGGIYQDSELEPPHARDLAPDRLPGLWARFGDRLRAAREVTPAPAHVRMAELERQHRHPVVIVTQNVDGLHAAAGSTQVVELHGSLRTMRCLGAGHHLDLDQAIWVDGIPGCPECGQPCRPDVVLFGESLQPRVWAAAEQAMQDADTVVAVGTSAVVYPAALLIAPGTIAARQRIWINPEAEPPDDGWTWLKGDADTQVARLTCA